ncbi:menaquinone biosynthesis protein [Pedobacter sp. MC2016-14]|uniref:menaquinone biosynthetic enzyme MqnA/MqnD family protein n=1 Tax=Pedobacter sp. MC2016-14 TaxID=2897327 RepID=UPI001E3DEC5B|nr:menaquinone biosynthesis protein [Pedobacter sp. MC2016-14]MCD0489643.1 menaquinone biosynthesis protein [Pedobacter sp. MC2016-14]
MNKLKISAVSYTNTKPFLYGIERSEVINQIDLSLDIPSDCAAKLIDGQVDIGLIPVAAFPQVPNGRIIADYCIGSVGAVNSVFIFSAVPVNEIKTLRLDAQSRTSNNLARVLLKFFWKQEVQLTTDPDAQTDAIVLIGDRTFGKKDSYAYAFDLGEEWMNFTGLPFLYAAWIANKDIPDSFIAEFNKALKFGLDHRKEVLKSLPAHPEFDVDDYLMHKLDFELTEAKRTAMNLFLGYIAQL